MDKRITHHQDLYTEKQALLPADPTCEIELTDADLEAIYGGSQIYTQPYLNSVGLGGSNGSGNGGAGLGSQQNGLQKNGLQISAVELVVHVLDTIV